MAKPPIPPKDDEEDTQIFDSNKYPVLDRSAARAAGPVPRPEGASRDSRSFAAPVRKTPTAPPPTRPTPGTRPPPLKPSDQDLPPQPTRIVVMQVPPEAIPERRDKRDSQLGNLGRDTRPNPEIITKPFEKGLEPGIPVATPGHLARPGLRPTPNVIKSGPSQPLPPSANTIIADIDAGVTSPDLKVPLDLRAALDSNPDLRAVFDSSPGMPAIEAGPTNIVHVRQDSLADHNETNPLAVPIHAMAAHRSTAPMPVPEHTKIGVVERPAPPRSPISSAEVEVLAPTPPVGNALPPSDPIAALDAARVRRIPNRVRHVTPTAMNAVAPGASANSSSAMALAATVSAPAIRDEDDDDNFNETRERPIDRDLLRKLPQAAALVAFNDGRANPSLRARDDDDDDDALHPTPVVLSGPAQSRSIPVADSKPDLARPVAPSRGGLVWVWMVLAALAIAAAVAAGMWLLAS
jgi:hypothetical protein